MMKVHLGCGSKILKGWVNCDALPGPGVDRVATFEELSFPSGSVKEVYASHFLEHFGRHEAQAVLSKVFGWLEPDGKFWVAVPDFEACVSHYKEHHDVTVLIGLLMGGQKDLFDFHKMVFDYRSLSNLLLKTGFKAVERYDRDSHEVARQSLDDYSAAYLPHMDKGGRLMSLNILAIK